MKIYGHLKMAYNCFETEEAGSSIYSDKDTRQKIFKKLQVGLHVHSLVKISTL